MADKLTELSHCMLRKETIPKQFKDTSIIHQYKRKDSVTTIEAFPAYQLLERYCQKSVEPPECSS